MPSACFCQEVICEIIRKEKPPDSDLLSVMVYYRMEEYDPLIASLDLVSGEHPLPGMRRLIAAYTWNRVAKKSEFLVIEDPRCEFEVLKYKKLAFDHEHSCEIKH